ncbi:MAG: Calx-beta domain-containing protein, partial [Myxococcaceae bacterium]
MATNLRWILTLLAAALIAGCNCGSPPAGHDEDAGQIEEDAGGPVDDAGTDGGAGDGGAPGLSIDDVTVTEGNAGLTNATFTVTLSPVSTEAVTVAFATTDVTATEQSDYAPAAGSFTFAPGAASETFTIAVNGDVLNEGDETFTVTLSSPVNAPITDGQATITIVNDDPLPSMSINDVTVNEGSGSANFTVTLSAASGRAVTVNFATAGGTATAGSDFVNGSGTLTFAPGDTTRSVTVSISNDVFDEADESFTVTLAGAVDATVSKAMGVGTIIDDDATPTLSVNDVQIAEGNAGTTNASFTVALSAVSGQTVTVSYATSDGTATAGSDYVSTSGMLTFTPGVLSQTVLVPINGDTAVEPTETFGFTLSAPSNAILLTSQGTGSIVNDDGTGPLLSIDNVSVTETNTGMVNAVFTVTLSPASASAVTVNYATADGSALAPGDYAATNGALTFAVGVTSQTITVSVNGDALDEADETFTVNLSGAANAAILDGQGLGTIVDNDPQPAISINDTSVTEGAAGTTNMVFAVTLSAASGRPITIDYATASSTATAPTDYSATSGTITFAAGQTSSIIFVPVNGDTLNEANETFVVNLSNPVNVTILNGQGVGTINNDDPLPSLSLDDVSRLEGDTGSTLFVFTVTLAPASGQTVAVSYSTANGTASSPADFAVAAGNLSFLPGTTTQSITVQVSGDTMDEPNETFFVNLSSAVNATIGDSQGQGTIQNDDSTLPGLTVNNATVTESNGPLVFTVTLAPASAQTVTVAYATADATAAAGLDYTGSSGTLTFAAGETSKTIPVSILLDTLDEDNETFALNLSGATNAAIVDGQGVGTINDDDPLPSLAITDVTVTEGNAGTANATFSVALNVASGRAVTVNYATADGTATAGGTAATGGRDYDSTSGTLTFPAGTTAQLVTVVVNGDLLNEINETFVVNLSGAVNATIADTQGVGTINNDDPLPSLTINDVAANEGTGAFFPASTTFTFTVTLSAPSGRSVAVNYATANGTATAPPDYA